MFKKIEKCRICGNANLQPVVDLGEQMLTGVFPRTEDQKVTSGPLCLIKCHGTSDQICGLLQLSGAYDMNEVYGDNYGYRSGLNASMVAHLRNKVAKVREIAPLEAGDLIIDIGSNDGTTLSAYPANQYSLVGIDPTGVKFKEFYPSHVDLIPDFFSANLIKKKMGSKKAKVITSFSMFYDLDEPMKFVEEIREILHDDGIWVFEQSYLPSMLKTNSYDTICHEHLEYYGLSQINWMCDKLGLKIVDIELNDVNGGSFSITAAHNTSKYKVSADLKRMLQNEHDQKLDQLEPYIEFANRIKKSKTELLDFIANARRDGKSIYGLGASTKGNVVLQYCGITKAELPAIGEVNQEKFGALTPGTFIPIISEDEVLKTKPDYLLVLPWHFKPFFLKQEKFKNTKLVFPLPHLEIVG